MTSARKVLANRRNALKSTGPRSPEGKARSSRNATKHGFDSSGIVIRGFECRDEWEAHREGIFESLSPDGHLEETLADRIAVYLWRLRRIAVASAQAIAAAPSAGDARDKGVWPTSLSIELACHDFTRSSEDVEQFLDELGVTRNSYGVFVVRNTEVVLAAIERDTTQALPHERVGIVAERVFLHFGEDCPQAWEGYGQDIGEDADALWSRMERTAEALGGTMTALLATVRARTISEVPDEWAIFERKRKALLAHHEHEQARNALPSAELSDRIVRYEAHLERQLASSLRNFYAVQNARMAM